MPTFRVESHPKNNFPQGKIIDLRSQSNALRYYELQSFTGLMMLPHFMGPTLVCTCVLFTFLNATIFSCYSMEYNLTLPKHVILQAETSILNT